MAQLIGKRFEVHKPIGEGAMGEVFLGMDTLTGERVAIKALKTSVATPELVARFEREGQALRQLNHPNIVKVLASFEEQGQHYIVMEYVSGGSLRDLLTKTPQLPVEQVLKIGLELADALTRAHLLQIIHRDIKPANILIAEDGTPRLSDFGIASVGNSARMTETGAVVGTIDYLSPESVAGRSADERSDIWSFGVLLYEMLMGDVPFKGENIGAILYNIMNTPLPDLSTLREDIPPSVSDLLAAMLTKRPDQRISSIRIVGADIEAILRGAKTSSSGARMVHMPFSQITPTTTLGIPLANNNLPTQNTPFIGRERELTELDGLLCNPDLRLLTLLGPGGIGKTRLSIELASRQLQNEGCFVDGVFFVALAPLSDQAAVITAIAEAVQFSFFGSDSPQQQLSNYLREKDLLLVLDNFEHLMSCASIVAALLQAAPKLKVIVTTREKLNLQGEWVYQVEGMSFPDWRTPEELLEFGAIQLFLQSARRVQADFQLTEHNQDAVVYIVQLVQGMPLGIELAAAWLEMLSLEEIISEIEASLDFLESESRDRPDRHRSIRAVFDYSWNLMSEDERSAFSKLSIFKGGFTREAASSITGALLRPLTMLVNKSLIRRLPSGRYEVHELLRQYAAEKLRDSSDVEEAMRQSHADYYLELLANAPSEVRQAFEFVKQIELDQENIRAAIQLAIRDHCAEQLYDISNILYILYESRNLHREGVETFQQIADAFRHDPHPEHRKVYLKAITQLTPMLTRVSRYREAIVIGQEAATLAQELGQLDDQAWATMWWSYGHMGLGEYAESLSLAQQAADLARQSEVKLYEWTAQAHMGYIYYLTGDYHKAKATIEAAQVYTKAHGTDFALAYNYNNLGEVLWSMGQASEAQRLFQEAYNLFSSVNYLRGMAFSSNNLGGVMQIMGNLAETERLYRRSYSLNKRIGDRTGIGHSLSALGNVAAMQGRFDEARQYYEQAMAIRKDLGDQRGQADSIGDLANIEMQLGHYAQAKALFQQSIELLQQIGDQRSAGFSRISLAEIDLWLRDYDQAKANLHQALAKDLSNFANGWAFLNLSWVEITQGNFATAEQLINGMEGDVRDISGLEWALAFGQALLAYGYILRGDLASARPLLLESLRVGLKTEQLMTLSYATVTLGLLLHKEGDPYEALHLILPAIRRQGQSVMMMVARQGADTLEAIRREISASAFEQIEQASQHQTLTQAAQTYWEKSAPPQSVGDE
jgi:serine/threonine protein kinase/tetratricopeptide (TPR) repeat protein